MRVTIVRMSRTRVTTTNFGNYLRRLRLSRGFDNVSEYLQKYRVPITASYYRDIENGRKTLGLETAEVVCRGLEADSHEFFFALLTDLIPGRVMSTLNAPKVQEGDSSAVATSPNLVDEKSLPYYWLPHQVMYLNDQAAAFFENNIETLNCLLFICLNNPSGVTERQLAAFLEEKGIRLTVDELVGKFLEFELVKVTVENGMRRIKSARLWVNHQAHQRLTKSWISRQIVAAVRQPRVTEALEDNQAYVSYGMGHVRKTQVKELLGAIENCVSAVKGADRFISEENPPCLFALSVAHRPQYTKYKELVVKHE